jgi:hypothetical protein
MENVGSPLLIILKKHQHNIGGRNADETVLYIFILIYQYK